MFSGSNSESDLIVPVHETNFLETVARTGSHDTVFGSEERGGGREEDDDFWGLIFRRSLHYQDYLHVD